MDRNKIKLRLILTIFGLSLLVLIILTSYKISLALTDLTLNQQNGIDFLSGKEDLMLNYTSSEISHMNDVKRVINYLDYAFYLSLLICTGIITWYRKDQKLVRKLLFYGGIFTTGFLGLLLICIFFGFDSTFNVFHKIFFPQGNWIFPIDSLLIQTFPLEFFIGMSYKIFLIALILGGLFILGSYWEKIIQKK